MGVPLLWDRSSSLSDPRLLALSGEDGPGITFSWLLMTKGLEFVENMVGVKLAMYYIQEAERDNDKPLMEAQRHTTSIPQSSRTISSY